jgi:hypothetical protein
VKNGVPFDIAFTLPKAERRAYAVAIGELDGATRYDWQAMGWEQ